MKISVNKKIEEIGVVPVIKLTNPDAYEDENDFWYQNAWRKVLVAWDTRASEKGGDDES